MISVEETEEIIMTDHRVRDVRRAAREDLTAEVITVLAVIVADSARAKVATDQ